MQRQENNEVEDNSVRHRKEKMKQIKKKGQSVREITHYFSKVEKVNSVNKNIPTPDKVAIEQMDRNFMELQQEEAMLHQQIEEIKTKSEALKQQRQYFLSKSRNLICNELKNISQINRFFNGQGRLKLNQKRNQLNRLTQDINGKKQVLQANKANTFQQYFITKQLARLQKERNRLSMEISLLAQKHRIHMQQQSCYFAKEKWSTIMKRYQPLSLIGKGGFSQVYKSYDLYSHQIVALKLSSVEHLLQNCGNKHEYLRHIKRQYQIHKQLDHPNIVKLLQVIELESALCIVLQYCEGFTLAEYLKMEGRLAEEQGQRIVGQIASVIHYLNIQIPAIIHYDLKPQNIIFSEGMVKVLDFGICKIIDSQHSKMALTSQGIGTFWYLPPQVFASNNPSVSNKVDVWSLGIILYEIIFGRRPFGQMIVQKANKAERLTLQFGDQIYISERCKDFIKGCLERQQRRMGPLQLTAHSFLNNIDYE